jgi:hypothetical protein
MDEDAMYEFLGLREEDERAEKEKLAAEKENEFSNDDIDLEGAALPVDDVIPGEDAIDYDRDDPPMHVGAIYKSMRVSGSCEASCYKETI